MTKRVLIIGGGPAGHEAASHAARHGASVTLVEDNVLGGAAHLLDCVPSKSMIATGGAVSFARRVAGLGLADIEPKVERDLLVHRVNTIKQRLRSSIEELLTSQGVRMIAGRGRLTGPYSAEIEHADGTVEQVEADGIVLATGSRPRAPSWGSTSSSGRCSTG